MTVTSGRTGAHRKAPPSEGARPYPGATRRRHFTLGKYAIVAEPIPGSAQMLRYTVFVGRKRVGAMASMPTESDCRYLESPPPVPPLQPFVSTYRRGRPRKDAPPRAAPEPSGAGAREEIPAGILPFSSGKSDD